MKARPYQATAVQNVRNEWQNVRSTLVVMPTATGKTVTFSLLIKQVFPRRVLVLAHREELIFQAADKIRRVTGYRVDIEMAELRADMHQGLFGGPQVVVSTIQTMCSGGDGGGRMARFKPTDFSVIIIDEAHHATAATFKRVVNYFGANPNLKILGVTATPDRSDEEALGQIFDTVAYDYEILDAIRDGWLVGVDQQFVSIAGLDYSDCRTTAGDLNGADLAKVVEFEKNLLEMAGAAIQIAGDESSLFFCASVVQAGRMAEILNRYKPGSAAWVCGKTDKEDRRKINQQFQNRAVQFLCNVGTHTEGFDAPNTSKIFMGRPTKSRSLYAQMAGRALRPLEEIAHQLGTLDYPEDRRALIANSAKPRCEIVDFVGNSGRHKLMTSADILGGNVSPEAIDRAVAKAKESGGPVHMAELLEEEEEEIIREREQKRLEEAARRARLKAKVQYSTKSVNPFDVFDIRPNEPRGWDQGKTLSDKQRGMLLKMGIDPDAMPYTQSKQLLNEVFRRLSNNMATFRQAKILKRYGYNPDCGYDEAKKLIDAIAANRWQRPAGILQETMK